MENEDRFLEIWRLTLQERCLQIIHQVAKDVQQISEREQPVDHASDQSALRIKNLGGGALMLAFQPGAQSNAQTASHLKERYSAAFQVGIDSERMKEEGAVYASQIMEQICHNKLVNMADLYKSDDPAIIANLKESLDRIDEYISAFEQAYYFCDASHYPDAPEEADSSKLHIAAVLLPLLQNAVKAEINRPSATSGFKRPSPWTREF